MCKVFVVDENRKDESLVNKIVWKKVSVLGFRGWGDFVG